MNKLIEISKEKNKEGYKTYVNSINSNLKITFKGWDNLENGKKEQNNGSDES